MWLNAYRYFIKPVGGSFMWPNTKDEPPLPPIQRKMPVRPRKLRIKHVTKRVNEVSRSGRMMTCQICWEKGHNKNTCKNRPKPKPRKEKRAPRRKKASSSFVFPRDEAPNSVDESGAGPSYAADAETGFDENGEAGEACGEVVGDAGVESGGVTSAVGGEVVGDAGVQSGGAPDATSGEAAGACGEASSYAEVCFLMA